MSGICSEFTKHNLVSDNLLRVKLLGANLQHCGLHDSCEINLDISREG
jgi:hypothetical protein